MRTDVRSGFFYGPYRWLCCCMVLAASTAAVEITLFNEATFSGDFVSQNDNFVVISKNGSNVSIAKKMIARIADLPAGVIVPLSGDSQNVSTTPAAAPSQATPQRGGSFEVHPGMELEITVHNGSKFVGTVITSDDRVINLQAGNGSRVNVYRHIISGIIDRTTGKPVLAPPPQAQSGETASPQTPAAAPATAQPATPSAHVDSAPSASRIVPPAAAAPANDTAKPSSLQNMATRSVPDAPPRSTIRPTTAAPAITTPTPLPLPAAPVAPAHSVPAPQTALPPATAKPTLPASAPQKRADGKSELLLKNGTSFVGTVVSENERFIALSTSDGTTINIIKRLIKTIDGVPYTAGSSSAAQDTAPRPAKTTQRADAPKPAQIQRDTSRENFSSVLPKVDLKQGISAAELTDSLSSPSPVIRSVAARQLGGMGQWAASSIPRLAGLLTDTALSSEALPIEVDSASIQKLLAPGFEAARSLARIGTQGLDALKKNSRAPDPAIRAHAVFGLGCAPGGSMLAESRQALKDAEPAVRISAIWGLRTTTAVADLCEALKDRDGDVRIYTAATLAALADPGSVPALTVALKDLRPQTRLYAARALGNIGAREAVNALILALVDASPEVRSETAAALAAIADTAAVTPLCVATKDKHPAVRKNACLALGAIRDPRAIPTLYTAIQEENDPAVRPAVELALKQHTEIPLLIAALDDRIPLVRENAAYILWLMTGKDIGLDKQAWTDWYAQANSAQKKKPAMENSGKAGSQKNKLRK